MSIFYRKPDNPDEFERIKIPTIKGDKGDQGDKGETGEKGDRGERGVYVGDDLSSFTEDQLPDLWLQPVFGEMDDIIQLEDVYLKEEVDVLVNGLKADIGKTHTHQNFNVLEDLNTSNGVLTFKGQPVVTGDGFDIEREFEELETNAKTLYGAINEIDREAIRSMDYTDDYHQAVLPGIDQRMDTLEGQFITLSDEFVDLKDYVTRTGGAGGGSGSNEARDIIILDASGYYAGVTVESALQEAGSAQKKLDTRLTELASSFTALNGSFESLRGKQEESDGEIEALRQQVTSVRGDMGEVLTATQQMTTMVSSITDRVNGFEEHAVTQNDFDQWAETNGELVQSLVEQTASLSTGLTSSTQNWQMSIEATNQYTYRLQAQIDALLTENALLVSRITALETNGSYVPVATITLSHSDEYLIVGETLQLSATLLPSNATNQAVTWQVGAPETRGVDEDAVSVTSDGLVRAIRPGGAMVYAITEDGQKTAYCNFQVISGNGPEA